MLQLAGAPVILMQGFGIRELPADEADNPGMVEADGAEIANRELNDGNGWSATFMDLPVYRERDIPYVYSVTEDPVDMYTSSTTGTAETGLNIVNTYLLETVKLSDGRDGQVIFINRDHLARPTIKINDSYLDLATNKDVDIVEII